MGKTFAQKILEAKSGRENLSNGEIVEVEPDKALSHDNTAPIVKIFDEIGVEKVYNPDIHCIVLDHCTPPSGEKYAQNHKEIREFVKKQGIEDFYDIETGICHQVLPEKGHAPPGSLILGSDSHTTTYGAFGAFSAGIGRSEMAVIMATGKIWLRVPETVRVELSGRFPEGITSKDLMLKIIGERGADGALYKAVEFCGETVESMSIASRMVLSNMSAEMGAKLGYCRPDKKIQHYVKTRTDTGFEAIWSDRDAEYEDVWKYDVADMEPQVASPHTVDNVSPVGDVKGVPVDQVVIGTCTNGRLEDIDLALQVLRDSKVHPDVRLLIFPASMEVYQNAVKQGYVSELVNSGAVVMNPGCGPCLGAHEGTLAPGEVCLSTANRNFKGRMGCPDSEIYLGSPATAAASAVKGEVADFREVYNEY